MKTFKQKLIEFMRCKEDILSGIVNKKNLYFNKYDEAMMETWTEKECKKIYKKIVKNIKKGDSNYLDTDNCPFCIKYLKVTCEGSWKEGYHQGYNCDSCLYKVHHKECGRKGSDFTKISKSFYKDNNYLKLNNNVYRLIIRTIEEKEFDFIYEEF